MHFFLVNPLKYIPQRKVSRVRKALYVSALAVFFATFLVLRNRLYEKSVFTREIGCRSDVHDPKITENGFYNTTGELLAEASKQSTLGFLGNSRNRGDTTRILLMASYRSGSSFIGELFNENERFFYVFEPGRILKNYIVDSGLPEAIFHAYHIEMLKHIFTCDFNDMDFYFREVSHMSMRSRKREIRTSVDAVNCTRNDRGQQVCQQFTPDLLRSLCRQRAHIAVKSIRIGRINDIIHLVKDVQLSIKVVHIIRDPRGRLTSWMDSKRGGKNIYDEDDIDQAAIATTKSYCKNWLDSYFTGMTLTEKAYFKDSYLFVRYEDMAEHPHQTADKLYRNLGLRLPDEVRRWIGENTVAYKADGGMYGTSRDSRRQSQAWREKLTARAVRVIEQIPVCGKMMTALGYEFAGASDDILKNRNRTLVKQVPDFHL